MSPCFAVALARNADCRSDRVTCGVCFPCAVTAIAMDTVVTITLLTHLQTMAVDAITSFHSRTRLFFQNVHFVVSSGGTAFFEGSTINFERNEVSAATCTALSPWRSKLTVLPAGKAVIPDGTSNQTFLKDRRVLRWNEVIAATVTFSRCDSNVMVAVVSKVMAVTAQGRQPYY